MASCSKISVGSAFSCTVRPTAGIEQRIVLINKDDLPKSGITLSTTAGTEGALITKLQLLAGKQGYIFEGFKNIIGFETSLEKSETSMNGFKHSIKGIRIFGTSPALQKMANDFASGGNVYAVLERKNKGTNNADAFLFFGLSHGLELSASNYTSKDNDGCISLDLSTPDGLIEPYLPAILLTTDYTTTLTAFNNAFKA